jgi:protease IV
MTGLRIPTSARPARFARAVVIVAAVAAVAMMSVGCRCSFGSSAPETDDESETSYGDGLLLEFDLSSGVPEARGGERLFPIPVSRTYIGLIQALGQAEEDERITGVFVRLGTASLGMAQSEELARRFKAIQRDDFKVWCHADGLNNATAWFFLQICDSIWMSPGGVAETIGVAGQVVYLHGALERLNVQADFLHVGRFKSASEQFTRDGPSDAAREAFTTLFSSIRNTWITSIQAATSEAVAQAVELGPYDPKAAVAAGLVHEIGYASQARETAQEGASAGRTIVAFGKPRRNGGQSLFKEIFRAIGSSRRSQGGDFIAVVPATGAITSSGSGIMGGDGIASDTLVRRLRRLAKNDSAKAVVIRIDSPGGSALASDVIWHEVMELRKKKPVVASVGSMAASGGYYIASATDRVFAENTSIVGSIGVLAGKFVVSKALADIGINAFTFPGSPAPGAGDRATFGSPLTPWNEAMRARMSQLIHSIYDLFIARVAEGRGMPEADVRKVAEGRVWTGAQGLEFKLVDEIGGLEAAVDDARRRADVEADTPMRLLDGAEGLFETLIMGQDTQQKGAAGVSDVSDAAEAAADALSANAMSPLLEQIPEELRVHVSSLEPLSPSHSHRTAGERVVAALPYAIVVK